MQSGIYFRAAVLQQCQRKSQSARYEMWSADPPLLKDPQWWFIQPCVSVLWGTDNLSSLLHRLAPVCVPETLISNSHSYQNKRILPGIPSSPLICAADAKLKVNRTFMFWCSVLKDFSSSSQHQPRCWGSLFLCLPSAQWQVLPPTDVRADLWTYSDLSLF